MHAATVFPATRGAVTALIGVSSLPSGSSVQTIDLYGDGGSILSEQPIAQSITSTGPLGDLTVTSVTGINNVTAPSIFGNISTSGPIYGTIQTTGIRTDPVTGATSSVSADLGRVFVVPAGGRNANPFVTATTLEGGGNDSLSGRIISRGNLISFVRSDGTTTGQIDAQGNLGAFTTLLNPVTPARVGGLQVNGGFSGEVVILGSVIGDMTFHGGITDRALADGGTTGGSIAVAGRPNPDNTSLQNGILGNVIVDRGQYTYGGISPFSKIVSGGEIGDPSLGTSITTQDGNSGIVAAKGIVTQGTPGLGTGGYLFSNTGAIAGNPDAMAIDAIFTNGGDSLTFDLTGEDLAGLKLILQDLEALTVDPRTGRLIGPVR